MENSSKEDKMRNHIIAKVFVYFICVSFLVMMNGFKEMMTEAREENLPIGQMISKGKVKIETKENIWKLVEPSAFPLFQGTKVKTEKGVAVILLQDLGQIEVRQNSLFSFDQKDCLLLFQGSIDFRIQTAAEMKFRTGDISIVPSRSLQASRNPSPVSYKNEETIGSISIHPNGAVTVRTLLGSLKVINQKQTVLAALSSKEEITIPSTTVKTGPKVMVAQASDTVAGGSEGSKFLSLSLWEWVGVGVGMAGMAGAAVYAEESTEVHDHIPICP
jgi:hypothetical protein